MTRAEKIEIPSVLKLPGSSTPVHDARLAWFSEDGSQELWEVPPNVILWRVVGRGRKELVPKIVEAFESLVAGPPVHVFADASAMKNYDSEYKDQLSFWLKQNRHRFASPLK